MVKHRRRITELAAEGKFWGLMSTGSGTGEGKVHRSHLCCCKNMKTGVYLGEFGEL